MTDEAVTEGGGRCSVTLWTTAKSGPQWHVRLSEEADDELVDVVVARAVRAFRRVEEELKAARKAKRRSTGRPFAGVEPDPPEEPGTLA